MHIIFSRRYATNTAATEAALTLQSKLNKSLRVHVGDCRQVLLLQYGCRVARNLYLKGIWLSLYGSVRNKSGTYDENLSILGLSNDHSGFPTTFGSWGPLLAAYYANNRTELPGELAFWSGLVKPGDHVLEIGAGSGFISECLTKTQAGRLTLVEPEIENIKILNKVVNVEDPRVRIIQSKFEAAIIPDHDLILFPFDSLPMITGKKQRQQIFKIASERLRPGGRFAVHISSPAWVKKYLERDSVLNERTIRINNNLELHITRGSG